jgi:hypothetical protein
MRKTLLATTTWLVPTLSWAAENYYGPSQTNTIDRWDDIGNALMGLVLIIAIGVALLAGYFLPTIIANRRSLNSIGALFAVNLFFGWTLVFWIVCLIWAANGKTEEEDEFYRSAVAKFRADREPTQAPRVPRPSWRGRQPPTFTRPSAAAGGRSNARSPSERA